MDAIVSGDTGVAAEGWPRPRPDCRVRGSVRAVSAMAWLAGVLLLVLGAPPAAARDDAAPAPRVVGLQGNLELDNTIEVEIAGLRAWAQANELRALVPFIDGYPIAGNAPIGVDLEHERLLFHLAITRESEEAWRQLLGAPDSLRRAVTFSVGPEDGSPFDTVFGRYDQLLLTVISPVYGGVALALVLLTLLTLAWLARTTGIIRHRGSGGELGPYDLGRFQMAFWFSLVYASYASIWLITDAVDTITPSLLALMGISAGTALGEAMIDADRASACARELRELRSEHGVLSASADAVHAGAVQDGAAQRPPPGDGRAVQAEARLIEIEARLQELDCASVHRSRGFLCDLLSDAHGYRFDRFQILAFTLILGVIFLSAVYNGLTMPEFSPTLLALMGLSSGTYIGFKFPGQK